MIRLRTLGTIDLRSVSEVAFERVLAQPKRLAFLAYLALSEHGSWHRRDTLLALFWPELDEDHARSALRNTLHFLRRELDRNLVRARGEDIASNFDAMSCDARAFLTLVETGALEEGLSLYKGDFLPGVHIPGCLEFERWLDVTRDRLRRLARDTALTVAASNAAHGDSANAERWLRFTLNLFPDDEIALRDLVRVLDGKGDRTGALREYRFFAQRLSADYETAPSPESDAVLQTIRNRAGVIGPADEFPSSRPLVEPMTAQAVKPGNSGFDVPKSTAAPRHFPTLGFAAMTLLVLVSIGGAGLAWGHHTLEKAATRAVIEPFSNRTGRRELGSVGQMAAEWIEQALAKDGLLEVVPVDDASGGVVGHADAHASAADLGIGRGHIGAFRARWLITGSYYLEGDTLQLRADIIDRRSGRIRATIGPTRGPLEKPSQAIEVLTTKTIGAITQLTTGNGTEDRSRPYGVVAHPRSPEAVRAFRTGIDLFLREARYDEALKELDRAYALDTTDVVPLLEEGFIYWTRGEYAEVASLLKKVRPVAGGLPEQGRLWLEFWEAKLRGRSQRALEVNRRLIALVPKSGWELQGGYQALRVNRPAEAVKIIEGADTEHGLLAGLFSPLELEAEAYHLLADHRAELEVAARESARFPRLRSARLHEIQAFASLGRREAIEERLQNTLAIPTQSGMAPSLAPRSTITSGAIALVASMELRAHGYLDDAHALAQESVDLHRAELKLPQSSRVRQDLERGLASALYNAGRLDEARAAIERISEQHPEDVDTRGMLGTIAARQGHTTEATQIEEQLSRLNGSYLFGRDVLWRARIKALLGQREEAVALLRVMFEQGYGFGIELHRDVDLESLRPLASYRILVHLRG